MNFKIGKKIEKAFGKKEGKKLEKDIEKEVEKRVEKEVEEVKKEVEKKLHMRVFEGAKSSAFRFKEEFKKHVVVAVSAALGFLVAMSWRTPLQNSVNLMIENMGLSGSAIYFEFLSALVITLVAVLGLMWVSKWSVKD